MNEVVRTTTMLNAGVSEEADDESYFLATETRTAETEQLTAAEGEEKQTFAIKSVINPEDGNEISLQQAIVLGVILPEEGTYVNSVTGEMKPIATAMTEGLIKVCVCTSSLLPFCYLSAASRSFIRCI